MEIKMKQEQYQIRKMEMDDYDEVYALWGKIHGFAIRSIDDSREGIERFLKRNPTTSVVAVEEGMLLVQSFADMMAEAHAFTMSAWTRHTGKEVSGKRWSDIVLWH